ncbi:hypothetical protein TIFTF001_054376 [Ficus carica]|uniref:Uncharacterized protein n=1 Tax=Ficus carica TaxID=3494 RepID=A0AA88JEL7_FICCA|nr:hypothetical protein TIFTF001_054376 [Ficus carica]
MSVLHFHF